MKGVIAINIVDVVIIMFILLGFIDGYRKGAIGSIVSLIGTILIFLLSYYLKNPVAELLYTYLPFNPFHLFNHYVIFNILLYEALAFLIVFSLLYGIFRIILKITGIIEKILKLTIIFGVISKVIGGIIGIIESYVLVYFLLFILNQPFINVTGLENSKVADSILNNTIVLSNTTSDIQNAVEDISELKKVYSKNDYDKFNYESLDVLLKYEVVSLDSVKKLNKKKKLNIKNINELIDKYGGDK